MKRHALRTGSIGVMLVGIVLVSAAGGCGYSSKRPFPAGIQSVHVEMLQSREFRRELEFSLTEALVKRIEMDTPYRIADKQHADTLFTGEILEVRQNALGNTFETDRPRELGATIIMRYQWKDMRNGDLLVDMPTFLHMADYIPPAGESFTTGVAIRGIDRMAERIVETMETAW